MTRQVAAWLMGDAPDLERRLRHLSLRLFPRARAEGLEEHLLRHRWAVEEVTDAMASRLLPVTRQAVEALTGFGAALRGEQLPGSADLVAVDRSAFDREVGKVSRRLAALARPPAPAVRGLMVDALRRAARNETRSGDA